MQIAVWHNLGSGGGKRALYYHVKALKEAGHYLEAWTTDMASASYLPLTDFIPEHRKPVKSAFERNLKIKNALKREQQNIILFEEHSKQCIREIENAGFDLIFANSCGFSYMPYIGKFSKLPAIVYLGEPFRWHHEAMPENTWMAPYDTLRIRKIKRLYRDYFVNYAKRLRVKKEIEAARSYKKILVNSLYSRESVMRAYGLESSVCYLGIDTELFTPSEKKEPYVVGLGTIGRLKGVNRAIESIAQIQADIRPPLLWIANGKDPDYLKEMNHMAKNLEVDFRYYLNLSDAELVNMVGRAAVMIYTSVLEPFGLAPLEANACGTYVVAIAEGGVRESITNGINGTLVYDYNSNKLAQAIVLFTQDLEYAKKKGIEAIELVEKNWNMNFLADNICNEIENLII